MEQDQVQMEDFGRKRDLEKHDDGTDWGIFYGIGVGPGDPQLMTLQAVDILRKCQILAIPEESRETCAAYRIAVQSVPKLAQKQVLPLPVPMTRDQSILEKAYRDGAEKVLSYLKTGKMIAFITIGDVAIYSTYVNFQKQVEAAGGKTKMVSGIPSFCASAAALGIPLTKGSEDLHVLPGKISEAESGTEVYMKSGRRLKRLKEDLKRRMLGGEQMEVYAVVSCGLPDERRSYTIDEIPDDAGYMTTIVVKHC